MKNYVVEFDPQAQDDLLVLSSDVATRILGRLRELEENARPRGNTIKRLQGFAVPMYRFRVGDYRAVFWIMGQTVKVLRVIHRSQLDRSLRDLR